MSTELGNPVQAQWRVVRLSLAVAILSTLSLFASAMAGRLSWSVAPIGLIIGSAGLQIVYALRQEHIAGIQRNRSAWRAAAVALVAIGVGMIAFGCWRLVRG